jgi:hypothetical protein
MNTYFFVRFLTRSWVFDLEVSCRLFAFFFFANIGVSALSMALIALNRVIRISFPNKVALVWNKCPEGSF